MDLAGVLHAVAAQVRAGAPPGTAWGAVLGRPVDGQVPDAEVVETAVGAGAAQRARIRAVVAGAHVAAETGAPLADVLEQLADAVAADEEQAAELAAALAGPRATARVLVLLPALGLLVGSAMGARPWHVLADGGPGTALGAAGVVAVVAGHVWVRALLRRAGAP
ncbi:type II secretion system F family protein [Cellulomonas phragmiteti]|uniref:type II secretion system F family protein n=1 Tax=Cellulomonas phragmiteti TaxID=478780 RepID=UPI001943A94C|nr:type II secretion system F family protein [Cellulomonas phragmiteti]